MKVAVLAGDGIGPEIIAEALKVIDVLRAEGLHIETEAAAVGGAGVDLTGDPLPEATLKLCRESDAILLVALSTMYCPVNNVRSGDYCVCVKNLICLQTFVRQKCFPS